MRAAEMLERIVTTLRAVLRRAGKGAMQRASRRAGYRPDYFSGWVWPGRKRGAWESLRVGTVARALEVARLEPGEFFAMAFSRPDPVALFVEEARRLAHRVPEPLSLQHARRRFLDEPSRARDDRADVQTVDELEQLRQRDPDRARRRAAALVGRTFCAEAAAGALGVWASCARRDFKKLDHATVILGTGIEIAARHDLPLVVARLVVRAAYILGDRAEYERGLALAERATIVYSEFGDQGLAAAHYTRGLMLGWCERFDKAVRAFHAALAHLPDEPRHLKGSAWQCIAQYRQKQGRLAEAEVALRLAAERITEEEAGREALGKLAWIQARVATDRGTLDRAKRYYEEALEHIVSSKLWVDAALIAAERTRALASGGFDEDNLRFVRRLTQLVIPLQDTSPIAAAALAELIRTGLTGERITTALVDAVIEEIRRERSKSARAAKATSDH